MVIMLKINKITVIGITATIILTFFVGITGFFEYAFLAHLKIEIFHLSSIVLMLGICLGILSTFVKRKRKILFCSSIIIIILGQIIVAAIMGYMHPTEIGLNKEFIDMEIANRFIFLLWNNLLYSFITILTGPTIIYPYITLIDTVGFATGYIAANISFHGFEGVILWIGSFHIYPEFYAIYLACIAGIRISLKSFKAYISIRRNGIKSTLKTIKGVMIYELKNTMPKIIILLIIAALLESLWAPFWTNYWLQHIA